LIFWVGLGILLFACMVAGSYMKSWANRQERCDMTKEQLRTKLQHHGVVLTEHELDSLMTKKKATLDAQELKRRRDKRRHEEIA